MPSLFVVGVTCMLKTLAAILLKLVSSQLILAYRCCRHGGVPLSLRYPRRTQWSAHVLQRLGVRVWTAVSLLKRNGLFSIADPRCLYSFSCWGSWSLALLTFQWCGRGEGNSIKEKKLRTMAHSALITKNGKGRLGTSGDSALIKRYSNALYKKWERIIMDFRGMFLYRGADIVYGSSTFKYLFSPAYVHVLHISY